MFSEMLAEDTSFDIGGAAGGKVDDDGSSLSLVIGRLFSRESLRPSRNQKRATD
jgi:hypothetical protein